MPTLADKKRKLRQQAERARRKGSRADEHAILEMVLEELEDVDEVSGSLNRWLTTAEVAERLSVGPRTVADWCNEDRFPNARKTGREDDHQQSGEWRIPARDVQAFGQNKASGDDSNDSATFNDFESFT